MRHLLTCITIATLMGSAAAQDAMPITFSETNLGKLPEGLTAAKTGDGDGSKWKVVGDKTSPGKTGYALAQTAAGPTNLYNLCLVDKSGFLDGSLAIAVKAVGGKIDQGGGLLWRAKDADNYYCCRYNPLEENFRVYYVKAGKRTQLATKENVELPKGEWFTIAIAHTGEKIACSLNDKKLLEVTDNTFPDAGQVGLWCKADAFSHFDKLVVTPAKK